MRQTIFGLGKFGDVDTNNWDDVQRFNWEMMTCILLGIGLGTLLGVLYLSYTYVTWTPVAIGGGPVVLLFGATEGARRRYEYYKDVKSQGKD